MKAIAVIAFLFTALAAQAEDAAPAGSFATPLAAGHWQIAGSAGWQSITDNYSSQIFIAPRAEYFLCDHVSLGAAVGLYFYKNSSDNAMKLQYTTFGPTGTFYFSRSTVAPYFAQQALLAVPRTGDSTFGGISGLGVAIFANEHVSISPELDLTYADKSTSDLSLNIRIAAYL